MHYWNVLILFDEENKHVYILRWMQLDDFISFQKMLIELLLRDNKNIESLIDKFLG